MSSAVRLSFLAVILGLSQLSFVESAMAQKKDVPEPKDVTFETKDGVQIAATYYKSTAGKDATPVILLADLKDSRAVYDQLARRLQTPQTSEDGAEGVQHESFAVLAVDLRGHGDSTKQRGRNGAVRELDAAKLQRNDFLAMAAYDMEAVRKFLVDKNDAGELNINRLSIVGAGLGASVGVTWTAVDWSAPPLAVGKQGQDVKGLVLISPKWSYNGIQMTKPLRHPGVREQIAFMVMYGSGDRSYVSDAKRIEKQLERYHPKPDSLPEGEPHSLAMIDPSTKLQGTQLLTQGGDKASDLIVKFLTVHVAKKDFDWTKRGRD
ncbi:alpha/beta hydrolase [Aeoliella mucimassa]|nr:alpha/beta hydrolase [Aeoliella mucimassa]